MYLTVHAAAGAVIGNYINNALLAFILGFISHFILDRIPHKDPDSADEFLSKKIKLSKRARKFFSILLLDIGLLFFITILFYNRDIFIYPHPVIAGIAGAVLPDALLGIYFLTGNKYLEKFWQFHHKIHFDHRKVTVSMAGGMVTQVVLLAILIKLIVRRFLNYGG
jgi:hypothetical protein